MCLTISLQNSWKFNSLFSCMGRSWLRHKTGSTPRVAGVGFVVLVWGPRICIADIFRCYQWPILRTSVLEWKTRKWLCLVWLGEGGSIGGNIWAEPWTMKKLQPWKRWVQRHLARLALVGAGLPHPVWRLGRPRWNTNAGSYYGSAAVSKFLHDWCFLYSPCWMRQVHQPRGWGRVLYIWEVAIRGWEKNKYSKKVYLKFLCKVKWPFENFGCECKVRGEVLTFSLVTLSCQGAGAEEMADWGT